MIAFYVSFAIGIVIWFIVVAYRSYSEQYFETFEDEVLVTSKFFKGASKCITAFYKGAFMDIESNTLYTFAKENENIKVLIKAWYINGKCTDFEIMPLDDTDEYYKLYSDDEIFEDE